MNERIKLLAEQCKEYVDESSFITYGPIWWEFYNEKFAELIVGECIGIVKQRWINPDEDVIAEEIKQHFGVEE
jgi:hypothetical protein